MDFGLTFHTDEDELHQIQSPGYKSPEATEWNKYKDDQKKKRKRKLQGTYSDLTKAAPAYSNGLQNIGIKILMIHNSYFIIQFNGEKCWDLNFFL